MDAAQGEVSSVVVEVDDLPFFGLNVQEIVNDVAVPLFFLSKVTLLELNLIVSFLVAVALPDLILVLPRFDGAGQGSRRGEGEVEHHPAQLGVLEIRPRDRCRRRAGAAGAAAAFARAELEHLARHRGTRPTRGHSSCLWPSSAITCSRASRGK
jgi:hypothetical protein